MISFQSSMPHSNVNQTNMITGRLKMMTLLLFFVYIIQLLLYFFLFFYLVCFNVFAKIQSTWLMLLLNSRL